MLRRIFLPMLLVLLVLPVSARAGGVMIGGHAGLAMPVGDLKDVAENGLNAGLNLTIHPAQPFALGLDLGYLGFGEKDLGLFDFGGTILSAKSKVSALQATAFGRLNLSADAATPYLKAGAGLYRLKAEATVSDGISSASADESENKLGFNLGGGMDFTVGGSSRLGIEGLYHIIMTEGSSTQAVTLAARFGFGLE